eukprot:sb/3472178/
MSHSPYIAGTLRRALLLQCHQQRGNFVTNFPLREEGEDEDEVDEELESDDDEWDDEGEEYVSKLDDFDPSDVNGMFDLDHLECFDTILDDDDKAPCEFAAFKKLLEFLSQSKDGHEILLKCVDDKMRQDISGLIEYADKEDARRQSERIENQGGYNFTNSFTVPTQFNFG